MKDLKMNANEQVVIDCEKKNGLFALLKITIILAVVVILAVCLFIDFIKKNLINQKVNLIRKSLILRLNLN